MHSCLYRGRVRHRRPSPAHRFQYSTSWIYLDLVEIDEILRSSWLMSGKRFSPASYRRLDHFGDPNVSMVEAVHDLVERETSVRPTGPVRLLTQLRHFGIYFSPLNVFYCYDDDESLTAIVAEVSNTPWNERHCYVLWQGNRMPKSDNRYSHPKAFHVSPFMGMDSQYQWKIRPPGDRLDLSIGCVRQGKRIFHADMLLERSPLSDGQLLRCLLRRPVAAAQILGAIYYQALRLWMKKCQFYPHPQTSPGCELETTINNPHSMNSERLESR